MTNKNTRLRKARNIYRENCQELTAKNEQLEEEIKSLSVKDESIADENDVYDSDAEDEKP